MGGIKTMACVSGKGHGKKRTGQVNKMQLLSFLLIYIILYRTIKDTYNLLEEAINMN